MLNFLDTAGLFVWPILGLLVLVLTLTTRYAVDLGRRDGVSRGRFGGLLFWGVIAAVLGALGQSTGIYNGLCAIRQATEISPEVVLTGLAQSFHSTFCGIAVLFVAGISWVVLTLLRRRLSGVAAGLLLVLVLPATGLAGPVSLSDGGWLAEVGADRFLFVFDAADGAPTGGMSHSFRDGRQYLQCPFDVARCTDAEVEIVMHKTGVRYAGEIDLTGGRITGGLQWDDGGMDLDLTWTEPATEPGYTARSETDEWSWSPPAEIDDGWSTAEASDIQPQVFEGIVGAIEAGRAGLLHSLLVVHRGELVCEEYFHGYDREALHPLASVTKSVSGLLVGVAHGTDAIEDLDAPLLDFFPGIDTVDEGWRDTTLKHLLTMSLGLDWTDAEAHDLHATGPEFFAHILGRGFVSAPGEVFRYVNANVNLVSGVIVQATGMSPEHFASERFFGPLGIDQWQWAYLAEGDHRLMDGSLQLRPRDMAKLGQMMLDGGTWRGEQILPADFAAEALSHLIDTDAPEGMRGGYGYLWWTLGMDTPQGALDIAFANGWGSQFIIVVPTLELVIVTTGGNQDNGMHMAPRQAVVLPLVQATATGD